MTPRGAVPVRSFLAAGACLVLAACASPPYSSDLPLEPGERVSRDAAMRFRVPAGWIDAGGESADPRRVVWLVRSDYAASIAVQEIVLDSVARAVVARGDVCVLAGLVQDVGGDAGAPPEAFTLDGRRYCAWEGMGGGGGKAVRVAVFAAGAKSYEVRAVAPAGGTRRGAEEVFRAQQKLLESLRW